MDSGPWLSWPSLPSGPQAGPRWSFGTLVPSSLRATSSRGLRTCLLRAWSHDGHAGSVGLRPVALVALVGPGLTSPSGPWSSSLCALPRFTGLRACLLRAGPLGGRAGTVGLRSLAPRGPRGAKPHQSFWTLVLFPPRPAPSQGSAGMLAPRVASRGTCGHRRTQVRGPHGPRGPWPVLAGPRRSFGTLSSLHCTPSRVGVCRRACSARGLLMDLGPVSDSAGPWPPSDPWLRLTDSLGLWSSFLHRGVFGRARSASQRVSPCVATTQVWVYRVRVRFVSVLTLWGVPSL